MSVSSTQTPTLEEVLKSPDFKTFDIRFATDKDTERCVVTSNVLRIARESISGECLSILENIGPRSTLTNRVSIDEAMNGNRDFRPDSTGSSYEVLGAALEEETERIREFQRQLETHVEGQDSLTILSAKVLSFQYATFLAWGAAVRLSLAKDHLLEISDKPLSDAVFQAMDFLERRTAKTELVTDDDRLAQIKTLSLNHLRHRRVHSHLTALASALRVAIPLMETAYADMVTSVTDQFELPQSATEELNRLRSVIEEGTADWKDAPSKWDDEARAAESSG